MTILLYSYIAILGLLIGSFLNVCALRLPKAESIVFPASHCPHCKTRLSARELIPIFSYLWQKGQCRHCQQHISALYPLGELLTASLFVIMFWQFGVSLEWVAALILSAALVVAVVADVHSGFIPFRFMIPSLGLMLAVRAFTDGDEWWHYALAVVIVFAIFYFIHISYFFLTKKKNNAHAAAPFGGGDIVLFMLIAATIGIKLTLLCLFLASLCGILMYALRWLPRDTEGKGTLRFAPAILPAAIISYLWGETLLTLYFTHILQLS
jgi:leader peptidase (prepilin peptidase)/N-methyltransferase